jgi:hypothetical protein
MYQKITDGFMTLEQQKNAELIEEKEKLELPMSYIVCPICDNDRLEKCPCAGEYHNYYCGKCSFQHINHHHKGFKIDGDAKYIKKADNGVVTKTVRK